MCEVHSFVFREGKEEKILENVDLVELEEEEINLMNIFGEQKRLNAKLRLYDNTQRKILFEPT